MTLGSIAATGGSLIVGGVIGTVTVISLVSSQTSASGPSPANANDPVVEYGVTQAAAE